MELTRRDIRAMIYYDYKSAFTADQSHERLAQALGDSAPSVATVKNWFAEFRRGRQSLDDEPREGRPADVVTREAIDIVREIIITDPRATYVRIQLAVGLSPPQVSTILHENLHVTKRTARWIPHHLTQEQKAARVEWCQFMLKKFNGESSRLTETIATGDESWIYQYDPLTKQQSQVWMFVRQ